MTESNKYVTESGDVYIKVDTTKIGHEIENLSIIIKTFKEKCEKLKQHMKTLDEDSDEYYDVQDEMNDCEMIISFSEGRYEDLVNLPKS